jgi:hypothetical protein
MLTAARTERRLQAWTDAHSKHHPVPDASVRARLSACSESSAGT